MKCCKCGFVYNRNLVLLPSYFCPRCGGFFGAREKKIEPSVKAEDALSANERPIIPTPEFYI